VLIIYNIFLKNAARELEKVTMRELEEQEDVENSTPSEKMFNFEE